jgi:hypothetical protein
VLGAKLDAMAGAIDAGFAKVVVKLDSLAVVPTPKPEPVPPAPPVPVPVPTPTAVITKPFAVTLVYDDASITPAQSLTYASPTLGDSIKALGGHVYGVKVGSKNFVDRKLDTYTRTTGTPALIVQEVGPDPTKPVLPKVVEKAPDDEASVVARIKALVGAN